MDSAFCIWPLGKAFKVAGRTPQVFNTDQGSQYSYEEWISEIESRGIKVSMDGKSC